MSCVFNPQFYTCKNGQSKIGIFLKYMNGEKMWKEDKTGCSENIKNTQRIYVRKMILWTKSINRFVAIEPYEYRP